MSKSVVYEAETSTILSSTSSTPFTTSLISTEPKYVQGFRKESEKTVTKKHLTVSKVLVNRFYRNS